MDGGAEAEERRKPENASEVLKKAMGAQQIAEATTHARTRHRPAAAHLGRQRGKGDVSAHAPGCHLLSRCNRGSLYSAINLDGFDDTL